jgi:hypothetical protein
VRIALLVAGVSVALLAGCGEESDEAADEKLPADPVPAGAGRDVGRGFAEAGCDEAALGDRGANWRDENTTYVGSVGFYGRGRDFRSAFRGGQRRPVTKVPVLVEGQKVVTIAIAPADRARAGLLVGGTPKNGSRHPYARIRLVPCRDHVSTWWPAGFKLADPAPVVVLVSTGKASVASVQVGRP